MQLFGNSNKENIHSVGLVFEPNFFRLYYYADRDAHNLLGTEKVNYGAEPELKEISKLYPLYALTFNAHYTLLPNALFNEENAQDVLAFSTQSSSPNVDWNSDPVNRAKIIFERDILAEQYLDKTLPGLQLKHGILALILFCRNIKSTKSCAILLKNSDQYTIMIVEDSQSKYVNTIDAQHHEDVVYFLLYTLKTLNESLTLPLYLLGNFQSEEKLISALSGYLPNVNLKIPISTNLPLSSEEATENWLGVHASICAL